MTEIDNFLEHYGVKGMRWGVRARGSSGRSKNSAEANRAKKTQKKAKKSGKSSLTNKELADYNKRMELERKYSQLAPSRGDSIRRGSRLAGEILAVGATVNSVIAFSNSPAGRAIRDSLSR